MKKKAINFIAIMLIVVAINVTIDLIEYYMFNETYDMPTEAINSTVYASISYDHNNIDGVRLEFSEADVLWMRQVLEQKEFKQPLFEKKGILPMRQFVIGFIGDKKNDLIHIYDDGKFIIILPSFDGVAYFTELEMDYLKTIIEEK